MNRTGSLAYYLSTCLHDLRSTFSWSMLSESSGLFTLSLLILLVRVVLIIVIFMMLCSSQFSSVMSDSLRPNESQHARLLCPSQTPGVYSNSCPSSQWCHPVISSSVVCCFSDPNPSQRQGLFQWVNSSHEVAKVLEFQLQHQSFQWTPRTYLLQDGLVGYPCSPRDSQESSPTTVQKHQFFGAQLSSQSNSHIHTWPLEKPEPWPDGTLLAK